MMPPCLFSCFRVALLLITISPVFAQSVNEAEWTLVREEDSILLYTRDNPNSVIDEIKAETIVTGNMDSAVVWISDVQKVSASNKYVTHTELLPGEDGKFYFYQVINMPLWLQNHDFVMRVDKGKTAQGYFMALEAVDGIYPEQAGYHRVKNLRFYVSLTQIDATSFKLVYKSLLAYDDPNDRLTENSLKAKTVNKMTQVGSFDAIASLRHIASTGNVTAKR